ncbi:MAG: cytochrome c-type biogenesis protein CcmH [Candidatus Berkiellales bacterium]
MKKIALILLLILSMPLFAATQLYQFENPEQQRQFDMLLKEFRCVTCPNQNIGDSMAPVATAMREEIYRRLQHGESPAVIRDYLLTQYGDYVSYKPIVKKQTWGLWLGPVIILLFGLVFWLRVVHRGKVK